MKNRMEEQFDGICNKAMPLILFSFQRFKEPLIEHLRILYEAFVANNDVSFDENYEKIVKMIDNRETFDSNRERLIEHFSNRNKSYNDKFEELFIEIGKIKKRISNIRNFSKEKKGIKQQSIQDTTNLKITTHKRTCPACGYTWEHKGKGQIRKTGTWISCPKYNCKKYFKVIE